MNPIRFGDLAHWQRNVANTTAIKKKLSDLSYEMSSNKHIDEARHLGASRLRVEAIDSRLKLSQTALETTTQISGDLEAQQLALTTLIEHKDRLSSLVSSVSVGNAPQAVSIAINSAEGAFSDMVSTLNTKHSGTYVFSGNKPKEAPLPEAESILSQFRSSINWSQSPDQILAQAIDFFSSPTGVYKTSIYRGGDDQGMTRVLPSGSTINVAKPASNDSLARPLAFAALAASANQATNANKQRDIVETALLNLHSDTDIIVEAGNVGKLQERTHGEHQAAQRQKLSLNLERSELLGVDTFAVASELQAVETQLKLHFATVGRLMNLSIASYLK